MQQLATIIAPFFTSLAEIGEFRPVAAEEMPEDYQILLAHDDHMTVAVEAFFGSLVNVRVLSERSDEQLYCRTSLLVLQSTGAPVQLGVVRIHLEGLAPRVREEIQSGRTPLGRVLIRHNVLRRVQLHRLWRIEPGPALREHLCRTTADAQNPSAVAAPPAPGANGSPASALYGRSALIVVEGQPAVELLEIVTA